MLTLTLSTTDALLHATDAPRALSNYYMLQMLRVLLLTTYCYILRVVATSSVHCILLTYLHAVVHHGIHVVERAGSVVHHAVVVSRR
jgi:hypothetical protein